MDGSAALATSDICFMDAGKVAAEIAAGRMSSREAVGAALARIEETNPHINAICTLVAEQALDAARDADEKTATGADTGPLHGLPMAIKDLALTEGILTTFGSPIYKDFVPHQDALFVSRLKAAGAIILGKTNVPEFGAGSQTFNPLFGATRNPHDPTRTCGGSSGGAAAALACGMVALGDGSDLGGSLRNPAAFCNVVGFRPSPGRVPNWPNPQPWNPLPVLGPMARTVADAALLLSVMAGPDARDPISLDTPGGHFRQPLDRDFKATRIAWTPDLGLYPVEPEVIAVCSAALKNFDALGCEVSSATPDLADAVEVFEVLRADFLAKTMATDYRRRRRLMKDTLVHNIEQGLALSDDQVAGAEARRTEIYFSIREFLKHHDFLVLPTTQVPPFPIEEEWVRRISGQPMKSYIDWMASCFVITLTGLPAISVPCGFTERGLPIGLQIVGPHHGDFAVLQLAHAFEQAEPWTDHRPTIDGEPITSL